MTNKLRFIDWTEIGNWMPIIMIIGSIIITFMSLKSDVRSLTEWTQRHDKQTEEDHSKDLNVQARLGTAELNINIINSELGKLTGIPFPTRN